MPRGKTNGEAASAQESTSYLRRKKPVRVSRGLADLRQLPLRQMAVGLAVLALCVTSAYSIDTFLHSDERFEFPADGSGLLVSGINYIQPGEIRRLFSADFGNNLLDVPLKERQKQLASLPWVEQATVARVWTNHIWVHVEERQPVAFVRLNQKGNHETTQLVDRHGVFLELPEKAKLTLPVISGVVPTMPIEDREKRIELYLELLAALDSTEPRYSSMVSEVDVADPENAKATAVFHGEAIELQMGDEKFRHRFELFLKYFPSWKREFGVVRSVDLRFKGQVALE